MKKIFPFLALFFILMTGCKSKPDLTPEEKAKLTTQKFIEYISANKLDSAISIYPDCDAFIKAIKFSSMSVVSVNNYGYDVYTVTYNNSHVDENGKLVNSSIQIRVDVNTYKDKDIQKIIWSEGLIKIEPSALEPFLRKTGALIDGFGDTDFANDYPAFIDFANYNIRNTQMSIEELATQSYSGYEFNKWLMDNPRIGVHPRVEITHNDYYSK